jgi:putative DNA primase/helicase
VDSSDTFYYYHDELGYFKMLQRKELSKEVYMFLCLNMAKNISDSMVQDFIKQIKYRVYRTMEIADAPYIAMQKKKLLDIQTFEIIDADNIIPSFSYIDVDPDVLANFNGNAPPLFDKFLSEVLVTKSLAHDTDMRLLIQEMIGYYLLPTLEAHATFFLVGCGQNGKSVLLNVMRKMIGEEFIEAMSIEKLTTNDFAASSLIGKKINICLEEESSYVKSDKFKAMVSGDPISVERKYGDSFMWTPTVKYVFATNEMPTFSGLNYGLVRRIKIIPFNRLISEERKDTKLTEKLSAELSGILAWSIAGAKRLVDNGFKFTACEQSDLKIGEFKENISAAILFFNERYEVCPGFFTSNEEVYDEYVAWCERRGKKRQSYYVFIKDVETHTQLPNIQGQDESGKTTDGKAVKLKSYGRETAKIEF